MDSSTGIVDCACVIHGDAYSWTYVDRLYSMLQRHITAEIRLHVYTEADRPVPAPYIKHELTDWGISGPRRAWWYKIQLFNPAHHVGPMLYFDLDVVIVNNIDWILNLPLQYFWTVQDFKFLWRPTHPGINSSIMWWNTTTFDHVWKNFQQSELHRTIKYYAGDQDYLTQEIDANRVRFFHAERVKSWRWQCLDGGYDFKRRRFMTPNSGTQITPDTSVLVFHGRPKPADVKDPLIIRHWQ